MILHIFVLYTTYLTLMLRKALESLHKIIYITEAMGLLSFMTLNRIVSAYALLFIVSVYY